MRAARQREFRAPSGGCSGRRSVPLCSLTIWLTMASPSPVPFFFVEKWGRKSLSLSSTEMPGPVSATSIRTWRASASYAVRRAILPFLLMASIALSMRLMKTRFICSGVEGDVGRDAGGEVDVELDVGEDAPEHGHDLLDDVVEPGRLEVDLGQAGEVGELVDERLDRLGFLDDDPGALLDDLGRRRARSA